MVTTVMYLWRQDEKDEKDEPVNVNKVWWQDRIAHE